MSNRRPMPDWLIPGLLSCLLAVLSWLANSVHQMAGTLAVAVSEIKDHDRRLQNLETLFLDGQ
jgi:hypothetical protein